MKFNMGRKKQVVEPDTRLTEKDKDVFFANLNLSPQPVVCLTRLNILQLFKDSETSNFSINIKSQSFKQLSNSTKNNGLKTKPFKIVKQKRVKMKKNIKISIFGTHAHSLNDQKTITITESNSDEQSGLCMSNNESKNTSQLGEKENQCIGAKEDITVDENDDHQLESVITRTDNAIDTFLNIMRKSADDNSILSALQRDFICSQCKQGFLKKETLRKHVSICVLGKKNPKRIKKVNLHTCPLCGITYLNKYSLEKHNANVHNLKKMYKCLVCSEHFYNEAALTLHCRSRHGLGGSDIYKCPYFCNRTFNFRQDLKAHCKVVHKARGNIHICEKCLECFKSEEAWKSHEQGHGHLCDICMFQAKSGSELEAHKLIHLYMVIYKCDRCERTFKAKRDFTKHIQRHERERKPSVPK